MSGYNINTDTRLNVPYAQKNAAKRLGAKWNPDDKFWYAPEGSDLSKFKRWLPSKPKPTPQPNKPPQPVQPVKPAQPKRTSQVSQPVTPITKPKESTRSNFFWPIAIIVLYLIFQLNYKNSNKAAVPPSNGQLKYEYYQSHGYRSCHGNEAVSAICGDGSESDSAGPGTCSHHNGVREYICPPKIEK